MTTAVRCETSAVLGRVAVAGDAKAAAALVGHVAGVGVLALELVLEGLRERRGGDRQHHRSQYHQLPRTFSLLGLAGLAPRVGALHQSLFRLENTKRAGGSSTRPGPQRSANRYLTRPFNSSNRTSSSTPRVRALSTIRCHARATKSAKPPNVTPRARVIVITIHVCPMRHWTILSRFLVVASGS